MADDARPRRPDLDATPPAPAPPALSLPAEAMDFFELMRRLERAGGRFAAGGRPDAEPARLGQTVQLAFATQDIAHWRPASDAAPARVRVVNFGLLGPEGPMPLHLTRWVFDRLSQRWFSDHEAGATHDTTFVDFANLLQHRMIGLFYRAWADSRPAVQVERPGGGRVSALLGALAGVGLPDAAPSEGFGALARRHATALGHQIEGPERLTRPLADALDVGVQARGVRGRLDAPSPRGCGRGSAGRWRVSTPGPRSARAPSSAKADRDRPWTADPRPVQHLPARRPRARRRARDHPAHGRRDARCRSAAGARRRRGSGRPPHCRAPRRVAWLAPRRAGDRGDLRFRGFVGFGLETAA